MTRRKKWTLGRADLSGLENYEFHEFASREESKEKNSWQFVEFVAKKS